MGSAPTPERAYDASLDVQLQRSVSDDIRIYGPIPAHSSSHGDQDPPPYVQTLLPIQKTAIAPEKGDFALPQAG
jgi:hypothetical protein